MSFTITWPELTPDTRAWLIAHNGEPLPNEITAELNDRAGTPTPDWIDLDAPDGPTLTDETVDWIEAIANDESAAT